MRVTFPLNCCYGKRSIAIFQDALEQLRHHGGLELEKSVGGVVDGVIGVDARADADESFPLDLYVERTIIASIELNPSSYYPCLCR